MLETIFADIMEYVLQKNASLGYTESTTAQVAAAAKMSIQEMRAALAAAKSLSQVRSARICFSLLPNRDVYDCVLCTPTQVTVLNLKTMV